MCKIKERKTNVNYFINLKKAILSIENATVNKKMDEQFLDKNKE